MFMIMFMIIIMISFMIMMIIIIYNIYIYCMSIYIYIYIYTYTLTHNIACVIADFSGCSWLTLSALRLQRGLIEVATVATQKPWCVISHSKQWNISQ